MTTIETINRTMIDSFLYDIYFYLAKLYGSRIAENDMYPLKWYINSGRATTDFLKKMISKKPYMIGRKLHLGGSYEDAVDRVCAYVGYKRCR